jgi:SAM-dependent methyltransferase
MFSASAEYYDLIYSTFKDYAGESLRIAGLVRELHPSCRTILDAACGTGEHARCLSAQGFEVDGLDLDAAFLRIARQKLPSGRFFEADMSDFHLPHRYDAVVCLFSSIGYLTTLDRVTRALICFRDHLEPGGVVLVEPWFGPGALDADRVVRNTAEADGIRITRVSRIEIDGRTSRLHFDYEISDQDGTRRAREVHELGLFTTDEMRQAFREAGFETTFDPAGFSDRGLYVATAAEPR